jgi:glycine cleavage system H lipoate-binding protein
LRGSDFFRDDELLNSDALKEGWIFKMEATNLTELNALMDGPAYNKFISG